MMHHAYGRSFHNDNMHNYTYIHSTSKYTNLCNYEDVTTEEEIPAEGEP